MIALPGEDHCANFAGRPWEGAAIELIMHSAKRATLNVVILAVLVYCTVRYLDGADAERKRSEEARENEARLRRLLDFNIMVIILADKSG